MKKSLVSKIRLTQEDKEVLELVSQQQVLINNSTGANKTTIDDLMEQGLTNAKEYLNRKKLGQRMSYTEENNLYKILFDLQSMVGADSFPARIECYDISHFQGKQVYGSMIVFINGLPSKKLYRLFRTKQQNDDYANLSEVIDRRFKRYLTTSNESWVLPSIIIIDGGVGQLSTIHKRIEKIKEEVESGEIELRVELDVSIAIADIESVKITSIAKQEETLMYDDQQVVLEGSLRHFVQRMRDEAHRFGITNQRKATARLATKSELDDITGIGPKTKTLIIKEFGSYKNLVNELWDNEQRVIEALGESVAKKIKKSIN